MEVLKPVQQKKRRACLIPYIFNSISRTSQLSCSPRQSFHIYMFIYVYIWFIISSCYGSIPLTLRLIGRDGGFSTLCHCCRFAYQHRVLKMFPGSGYLRSEDKVVRLQHLLVNLYIQNCKKDLYTENIFYYLYGFS